MGTFAENAFDLAQDVLIGRTECVFLDLVRRDPARILVLEQLRLAPNDLGVIHRQMHNKIGISVRHFHEFLPDAHLYTEFFAALPHESFLTRFPRFHLAADELP